MLHENKGTEVFRRMRTHGSTRSFTPSKTIEKTQFFFLPTIKRLEEGRRGVEKKQGRREIFVASRRRVRAKEDAASKFPDASADLGRHARRESIRTAPSINCAASDTPSRNNGRGRMIRAFDASGEHKQTYATRDRVLRLDRSESSCSSAKRVVASRNFAEWERKLVGQRVRARARLLRITSC